MVPSQEHYLESWYASTDPPLFHVEQVGSSDHSCEHASSSLPNSKEQRSASAKSTEAIRQQEGRAKQSPCETRRRKEIVSTVGAHGSAKARAAGGSNMSAIIVALMLRNLLRATGDDSAINMALLLVGVVAPLPVGTGFHWAAQRWRELIAVVRHTDPRIRCIRFGKRKKLEDPSLRPRCHEEPTVQRYPPCLARLPESRVNATNGRANVNR